MKLFLFFLLATVLIASSMAEDQAAGDANGDPQGVNATEVAPKAVKHAAMVEKINASVQAMKLKAKARQVEAKARADKTKAKLQKLKDEAIAWAKFTPEEKRQHVKVKLEELKQSRQANIAAFKAKLASGKKGANASATSTAATTTTPPAATTTALAQNGIVADSQ